MVVFIGILETFLVWIKVAVRRIELVLQQSQIWMICLTRVIELLGNKKIRVRGSKWPCSGFCMHPRMINGQPYSLTPFWKFIALRSTIMSNSQTSILFNVLFPFQIVGKVSHEMFLHIIFNAFSFSCDAWSRQGKYGNSLQLILLALNYFLLWWFTLAFTLKRE